LKSLQTNKIERKKKKKMKDLKIYLLVALALVAFVGSILISGARASKAAASDKDVTVVNNASDPVPVTLQGGTSVSGTVAVSNFPDAVAILPAGTPITLHQTLGLGGPIHASENVTLFKNNGDRHINGQIAIGSISIASVSTPTPGEIYYDFFASDCSGNGLGEIRTVVAQTGSTTHLDFPIPQVVPEDGPQRPFCVNVTILNGNEANIIDITAVGAVR
jgi:hypothetical protein